MSYVRKNFCCYYYYHYYLLLLLLLLLLFQMVWLKLSLHRRRGDLGLIDKPKFERIMLKKYWYLTLNKLANRLVVKIFDFLPRDSFLYILFLRDISMEVGHFKKGACFLVLVKSLLISHWPFLISHWPFLISHYL